MESICAFQLPTDFPNGYASAKSHSIGMAWVPKAALPLPPRCGNRSASGQRAEFDCASLLTHRPEQGGHGSGALVATAVPDYLVMDLRDLVGECRQHRELALGIQVGVAGEPVQSGAEVLRIGPELQLVEIIRDYGIGFECRGYLW